jgi:hypothetical protein
MLAIILAVITALAPGATPEYAPAGAEAYTLDLQVDGYVNGAMDRSRLMTLEGCTLERDAAYMYALLMEAAEQDGIDLGWEDCYRSFNVQKASYDSRCPMTDEPIYAADPFTGEQILAGSKSVRVCTGPPIARAGFSNHGWGRAVDFTSGRSVLGCDDKAYRWMQGNAHRFGWVNPAWAWCDRSTREPWHWEYAGVTDPNLVGYNRLNPDLIKLLE